MTYTTISIVLFAALLHALWNAFIKAADDRLATLGLISLGHVLLGVILASQYPIPAPQSWPFIAGSTIIHFAYYFLLYHSYRLGDLSHVYPIARGMSPVLVALGAQVFAGEVLPPLAWGGILLTSLGIFMLAGDLFRSRTPPLVVLTALATGAMIASYSLIDGMGVRVAATAFGYIGWLFIAEIFTAGFIFARLGRKMLQIPRQTLILGLIGGLVSACAYGLVIYVKAIAPLGMVSTLRETSVVFATLIGMIWLKERPWKLRLLASIVVVSGVILITFAA
ncbi:MAG: EamA family transporter [Paracoccaceae bacterium]